MSIAERIKAAFDAWLVGAREGVVLPPSLEARCLAIAQDADAEIERIDNRLVAIDKALSGESSDALEPLGQRAAAVVRERDEARAEIERLRADNAELVRACEQLKLIHEPPINQDALPPFGAAYDRYAASEAEKERLRSMHQKLACAGEGERATVAECIKAVCEAVARRDWARSDNIIAAAEALAAEVGKGK